MVIFFCLYYYVITVTHPKILTTSQTPQGQPKGSAHVEGGASSTSQRGHTATCCTPHLSHAECWRGKRCRDGMGLSRLILLHSNKTSCNSWHYQLTTGSCHLPLLNKLDHRSTSSTSKPPACPTHRALQKHQSLSAYHQVTPKTSKYFSQIASFHEVFLLKTYI